MELTRRQLSDAAAIAEAWIVNRAYFLGTPAVSYGLAHEGTTVLSGARGVSDVGAGTGATERTGYRVASITKTFTATLAMQLVERGKLRLDEPVVSYLGWLAPALGDSGLTVRHLLTHSGGIIRDGSCGWRPGEFPTRDEVHRQLLAGGTFAAPAVGFRYSNMAYALLGEIVETAGGRQFATEVDRRIVRPLGLAATGTRLTPPLRASLATGYWRRLPGEDHRPIGQSEAMAFEPAGGLISNVGDLLAYQHAHLPGEASLLGELSKREMQRVQWQRAEEPHHGLGWIIWTVDGIGLRGHSGGYPGFTTQIGFAPDLGLAAAVLTNTIGPLASVGLDVIFHTIARVHAVWDDAAGTAHGHTRSSLARLAGLYRGDWGDVLIARVNNSLYLLRSEDDRPMRLPSRLAPVDDRGRFVIVDNDDYGNRGEHVVFEGAEPGPARSLRKGWQSLRRVDG
ncbi:MAG: serine hydrolase domain-containing protein [Acidimicrobiales bacterium]|jgi:CubicO group peptidase (beta-lactamase class C family)